MFVSASFSEEMREGQSFGGLLSFQFEVGFQFWTEYLKAGCFGIFLKVLGLCRMTF
jgi:hypothetical protein